MPPELIPPFVLLDDRTMPGGLARLYRNPEAIVVAWTRDEVGPALSRLDAARAADRHVAGFLAYEAYAAFEGRLTNLKSMESAEPLLWFGVFTAVQEIEAADIDAMLGARAPPPALLALEAGHDRAQHMSKVAEVLDLIRAGDVYQVNLTFPLSFRYTGDPLALYAALRTRQPVAHGGVVAAGDWTVLSVSPELFVQVSDGEVVARPMKGTAPRGSDPASDRRAGADLGADPKSRAENLMITDLLRNDLSRVCRPGSVRTPGLFELETYPTFHALTSTVTGQLVPGKTFADLMLSLFPCGSVVGAPKIRAAEVIAQLETRPRGLYTGALGQMAPDGSLDFNVAIRTAVILPDGTGRFGVGGGIVADSDPGAEYEEALLKARVITELAQPYALIETLRWTPGLGFVRLKDHLHRLARSATALGFDADEDRWLAILRDAAETWTTGGDRRVRAVLARDGAFEVTHQPALPPAGAARVGVAAEILDAADPFLRHKTTRRATHDQAFAAAAGQGLDEALMLNRTGSVADASRHSVFLTRGDHLVTPPLAAGALPGVLRAQLLTQGTAIEGELRLDDLVGRPFWLGNSLNGLRPARLVPPT